MKTNITEQQYERATFHRFAVALSENGKTEVLSHYRTSIIAFFISLHEVPALGKDEKKEILAWLFLTHYAGEAWRVRNDMMFIGRIQGVQNPMGLPKGMQKLLYVPKRAPEEFELSFHDSEIETIDMAELKRFVVSVAFDVEPHWPVRPWSTDDWHYQWTEKGERLIDQNRAYRDGEKCGYLSWEEMQRKRRQRKPRQLVLPM